MLEVKKVDKEGNREVITDIIGETKAEKREVIRLNIPFIIALIIAFPPLYYYFLYFLRHRF